MGVRIRHRTMMCGKCQNVITSMWRHDFKFCACGELFVDGGGDYLRYGGKALMDGTAFIWQGRKHGFVRSAWNKVDHELSELFS